MDGISFPFKGKVAWLLAKMLSNDRRIV